MKGLWSACVIAVAVVSAITAPAALGTTGTMVVTTDTTLAEDHQGQIVVRSSGVTLDCGGHRITGPGTVGIEVLGTGATVQSCEVGGFGLGILVRSDGNVIRDNRLTANGAGIQPLEADDNLVIGNAASRNSMGYVVLTPPTTL